ncbi:MAG: FHA domain-containing protein [Methanoregula sp.]|jgi:DNA-binding transcriptional ArsR family regulator|uniref:FHA domain-containing protein n=1 Tax=Methanoregula sp. TaxID=2052170 RepID=UPI003C1CBFCB
MGCSAIPERKTVLVSSDPEFLSELSEYLEVLSSPVRLKILKFIEREPREITAISEHTGMTYQNTKKHMDRLLNTGLVRRNAGFGRETDRGIAPVWKYLLADGGMETLVKTLGLFSSIAIPPGYNDIRRRIESARSEVAKTAGETGPLLCLIGGPADGLAFILKKDRIRIGREDPDHPLPERGGAAVVPDQYKAVTRVTKPHAVLVRTGESWEIEDNGSTGGTFVNSVRLNPRQRTAISSGDIIDLSVGPDAARLLFVAGD